ncbi:3-hydroxyacyl-CoA dehydrogenase family protein [Paraburkholderia sp. RL17-383-BIF-A]
MRDFQNPRIGIVGSGAMGQGIAQIAAVAGLKVRLMDMDPAASSRAIRDSGGFIGQRIVASVVNTACEIAQQRIATPHDIDAAVRLGLGYPLGPLAFGDTVGAKRIFAVLKGLMDVYGDPRYRPGVWLARRAALAILLNVPD